MEETCAGSRPTRRRLSTFTGAGYDKGRSVVVCAIWALVAGPMLQSVLCPVSVRVAALRWFGADIGPGVLVRHDVRVHWPWKLRIGRDSWIGAGARLLNLEPIWIGSDVCISQEVLLCTGSHRADDEAFGFDNRPIRVEDGAWLATRATVLRGVTIGEGAVVGATALVTTDVAAWSRTLAPRSHQQETR